MSKSTETVVDGLVGGIEGVPCGVEGWGDLD